MTDNYSCNWVTVCKTKKGDVMGRYPLCQDLQQIDIFYPDAEYSHPITEGSLLPTGGWLYILASLNEMYQHNYNTKTR